MNNTFQISGQIVDLVNSRIFPGVVSVEDGKIVSVEERDVKEKQYIMPGFVDSHVHIESSMVVPSEFARMAVCHGTVATVSDPHEIANVMGVEGVKYMISNGKRVPFKFFFGAPSCVPATSFETSGFTLDSKAIEELMQMDDIHYLAEMMNWPGVVFGDAEVLKKIEAAKKVGKPIDGHAPAVTGDNIVKYAATGISTDHECFTIEEAEEKIGLGMKILIREGSAAKNFEALIPLMASHPEMLMFCSDDKHPNDLAKGHINQLVKRAIDLGYNIMDVLKAASLNAVKHYNLNVGLLQKGDDADFIVLDNLEELNVLQTYIKGVLVAEKGISMMEHLETEPINNFKVEPIKVADIALADCGKRIKVISCIDGQLVTDTVVAEPKVENGNIVSDIVSDILKLVVVNRYEKTQPAVSFIKNMGLKQGAIASSVAHDSHNIVAVGTTDEDIVKAVNILIENGGGVVAVGKDENAILPLPVAGLMSNGDGYQVAEDYEKADALAHKLGTMLHAPFMTLAFMSLLVIPELKLSDKGLFDGKKFAFTSVFED
ncbi:MAG: adenine deaminase [Bacteroidales bacterium]|nr:adenine deaminase [Bacteroidales bacterium]